jgi:hypothetical protein
VFSGKHIFNQSVRIAVAAVGDIRGNRSQNGLPTVGAHQPLQLRAFPSQLRAVRKHRFVRVFRLFPDRHCVPNFRLGAKRTRTRERHSPIPSGLKIQNNEQEARQENPHAPEDEKDEAEIVFAKANVIHNVRILSDRRG